MNSKKIAFIVTLFVALGGVMISCSKKFDEPPYNPTPNITANTTIAALKARHTVAGNYDLIVGDTIIRGVVVANDKSGNFYKEIYIQDATGGLSIQFESTSLYGNFPVGKEIFIKCKGLTLSDYGGVIQLGMIERSNPSSPTLAGIPATSVDNFIVGGRLDQPYTITNVSSVSSLLTAMQSPQIGTLVRLSNFEIGKGDLGKTWSDTSAFKRSVNLTIRDCSGQSIIIRSSGYANFAGVRVPTGNGTVTAVYTVFGTTRQLIIRDTSDVQFRNPRCFLFEEDFNAYPTTGTNPLVIPGWSNINETGDVLFRLASFSGSVFPLVSAFTSTALPTTNISTWLVTPDITLPAGGAPKFSYTCARRFPVGTFNVYVSTNFNGTNVATANWVLLNTVPANPSSTFTPFDPFGPFNLSAYAGQKINIAFRYQAPAGSAASQVATYEPDDIKITSN
ncbi:MAG: DUF5689 domain-containing protein [Chitinophagaceae bacterium]